jgi:Uma2 family endonuclease
VLSPTTELRDRTRKFVQYQQCQTIQEYILVSQQRQQVEVFTRNGKKWVYQLFGLGEEVELLSIDVRFPIEMLYEDVPLPVEEE